MRKILSGRKRWQPLQITLLLLVPFTLFAQTKQISGRVTDAGGNPLAGASIQVKKSTAGTVADSTGRYSLSNVPVSAVLVVSSVGYTDQEIPVKAGTDVYDFFLNTNTTSLSDVVVLGYATQRKVNMTGAVATINSKELVNRPVTNISSALGGLATGVNVVQSSGRPGNDEATIRVRGIGTLNNANALVVVDGIIGTMDAVNPNDVASISVLKDAAAASIYGAQAANGVILITTKKGSKGKPQFTYTGILSTAQPSNKPKFVTDYVRHMQLFNEGATNIGQTGPYQQSNIDLWLNAQKDPKALNEFGIPNYVAYPNTDWGGAIFENNLIQNHNFSILGGGEQVSYNISARYLGNPGIMHNTELNRYEVRANVEAKVAGFLTFGTQTFASTQKQGKANTDDVGLFNFLRQTTPGLYPYYGGRYGAPSSGDESAGLNNLLVYLYGRGGRNQTTRFNTTLYANIFFMKNLVLESKFNYQLQQQETTDFSIPLDRWNFATNQIAVQKDRPSTLGTSQGFNKNYMYTLDEVLRYNTKIGNHSIGALAGYNEYYWNYYEFGAAQTGLIDETITNIGTATTMTRITGDEYDRAMRSFFGRVNYDYDGKYLFEATFRRDASSHFGSNIRGANFPSFSAGWRISEEPFFQRSGKTFQDVKLRASWGQLGNDRTETAGRPSDHYVHQAQFDPSNYSFGSAQYVALAQSKIANPMLVWENTTQTDIGLEFSTFNRRLTAEFDYYHRQAKGILTIVPLPLTAGTINPSTINGPAVLNKGVEITLNWQDQKGDFRYSIGANFSYNYNRVSKYKGPVEEGWTDANGTRIYKTNYGAVASDASAVNPIVEGHLLNEYYVRQLYQGDGSYRNGDGSININGGPRDGMIRTPEDLQWVRDMMAAGYTFSPVNSVSKSQLYYGDFVFADLNGDKIYGNTFDRKFTGTSNVPKYIFGFNVSLSWKNFDFSMLWQGALKLQYYWNAEGYNNSIVRNGNSVALRVADDHYYYNEANPSDPANKIDGYFPRLKYNGDDINNTRNAFWLYDADYAKLKNLQIGYRFSPTLLRYIHLSSARIFFSGENLVTITSWKGLDPELGAGVGYPTMRQYAIGLNIGL